MDGLVLTGTAPTPLNITTQITTMMILELASPGMNTTPLDPIIEQGLEKRKTYAENETETKNKSTVERKEDKTISMLHLTTPGINVTTTDPTMELGTEKKTPVEKETRTDFTNTTVEPLRDKTTSMVEMLSPDLGVITVDPKLGQIIEKSESNLENGTRINVTNTTVEWERNKTSSMAELTTPNIKMATADSTVEEEGDERKTFRRSKIRRHSTNETVEWERGKRKAFVGTIGSRKNNRNVTKKAGDVNDAVMREGEEGGQEEKDDGDNTLIYVGIAAAVAAIFLVMVLVWLLNIFNVFG